MPLPTPDHGEPHDAFLSRCMGDETMTAEFPDQDQRAAVCEPQWQAEDKLCRLDLELKASAPSEAGEFTGIASVFGEVDGMGDAVAPGAFRKSLAAHRRAGRMPLMLWSHQLDQPIGRWIDIRETAQGLAVKGKLLLDVARAREVYAMLREKVTDGLSIGFRTVDSVRTKTGRLLTELTWPKSAWSPCRPWLRPGSSL
jgi:HK97 family phage prohead protease